MANRGLIRARVEADLTQERLAVLARVSSTTVVRAERGDSISALSRARIARALDCDLEDLFPESEEAAS